MSKEFTFKEIAEATKCPIKPITENWPLIKHAMAQYGITSTAAQMAMIATVAIETASTFRPIAEYGGPEHFKKLYDVTGNNPDRAKEMGNVRPGDGFRYRGHGYIQCTWACNFKAMSAEFKRLGRSEDPFNNPDILLQPEPSAMHSAFYFKGHGCATWADKAWTSGASPCKFCGPCQYKMKDGKPCNKRHEGLLHTGMVYSKRLKRDVEKLRRPHIDEIVCKPCGWRTVRRTVNGGLNGWDRFIVIVDKLTLLVPASAASNQQLDKQAIDRLRLAASEFKYNVLHKSPAVAELQMRINQVAGMSIRVDGLAGSETSDALFKLTGQYLKGDPRHDD